MPSSTASSEAPSVTGGSKLKDPCWDHAIIVGNSTQQLRCKYCNQFMSGGVSHLKQHLAGRQGNCAPCLKVPDNVKVKVLELLKEADAKKQAKAAGFQALVDDVRIGEDEFDYQDSNDCSSQRTKFGSVFIKAKEPMNKFTQRTLEELTTGFAKTKQSTMDSKQIKKRREDTIIYIEK